MQSKGLRYLGIFIAFLAIVCIRLFEDKIFYDPFLHFFKSDYQNKALPDLQNFKLIGNLFLRYLANSLLSITIIYLLFQNKMHVKIATFLYLIVFVVLIIVFSYLIFASDNPDYLLLFYIRRFLIQPILLLLLIPAFYFQKKAQ